MKRLTTLEEVKTILELVSDNYWADDTDRIARLANTIEAMLPFVKDVAQYAWMEETTPAKKLLKRMGVK